MGRGFASLAMMCALPLAARQASCIGAEACKGCHPAQFTRQAASPHARTLYRASEHPLASSFAPDALLERVPGFQFEFTRRPDGFRVRASDGKYVTELPLEWAFGTPVHAVTFVSKVSAEYYLEHSFSYYADTKSLDLTPGHESLPVKTLNQAMGQPLRIGGEGLTIRQCFECHSTGPVAVSAGGDVQVNERGVRCEACHGPGSAHRDAVLRQPARAKTTISNPGRLSAAELNDFCARCHRALTQNFNWDSAWNVRHQPPFLARSRCFRASGGNLACLTCHDPHEPARRNDAAFYRAKCLACHTEGRAHLPKPACGNVAVSDCTSCHMPLVQANAHLAFKNHWIGVYRDGARLRPGD